MTRPFDILYQVDKSDVIKLFSDHEANRPVAKDQFAHDRIESLKSIDNIVYHKIKFNESIIDFLMLPHHDHDIKIVPPYGKNIADALNLFFEKETQTPNAECILKIRSVKEYFYDNNSNDWTGGFILIGNNKDLAHPGDHYAKSDKEQYYIFNGFHRVMAYFLKLNETGQFKPLFLYYAEEVKNVG